jgi:hypothetical protein
LAHIGDKLESIVERFSKKLSEIIYPNEDEKKELWNISGRLSKHSNQIHKFDVRDMNYINDNQIGKKGTTASKADKMVFESKDEWIIIDIIEIHSYIKKNNTKVVQLEDLISKLDWNIILPKK